MFSRHAHQVVRRSGCVPGSLRVCDRRANVGPEFSLFLSFRPLRILINYIEIPCGRISRNDLPLIDRNLYENTIYANRLIKKKKKVEIVITKEVLQLV